MTDTSWVEYVTAIGSVATPVIVLALTAVGWRLRRKLDRRLELEDKLRDDRVDIYNHILEPFVILFTSEAGWAQDKKHKNKNKTDVANNLLLSLKYRKYSFKLSLVGSDAVVTAYNDLLQNAYARSGEKDLTDKESKVTMELLGNLLLQIRRSMGNETTVLDKWQMLEAFITDVRKIRAE